MNRIFFKALLALALILSANIQSYASMAYPGLVDFRQPNGNVVKVYMRGSETLKWAESEDGYTLLYDEVGNLVYAEEDVMGDIVPSDIVATDIATRSSAVVQRLQAIPKRLTYSQNQLSMAKQLRQARAAQMSTATKASSTGTVKMLVILVEFSDYKFKNTKESFNKLLNQINYTDGGRYGSVRDFYKECSFGQLDLVTDVVGIYKLSNTRAYYGGNDAYGNDLRPREMALAAIDAANAAVNFKNYDNNNDGYVDGIHIIYAGPGEEAGGGSNCIWAHSWTASTSVDGVYTSRYSCSPEIRGSAGSNITHIGVICHEIGHVLGTMDFYDTDYGTNGEYPGTGQWDLMASGSWNGDGACPAHFNPYSKIYDFGWASVKTVSSSSTQRLDAKSKDGFIRINTATSGEYFLLEYRAQSGFDSKIPGHGLMIYRATDNLSKKSSNTINASHKQQFYPLVANSSYALPTSSASSYGIVDSSSAPFPGTSYKTQITDNTSPSMKSWVGALTNLPITSISETSGQYITFNVGTPGDDGGDEDPEVNTFIVNGLTYEVVSSSNSTVELIDGKGSTGAVAIPNYVTHKGKSYGVISIGSEAFSGCSSMTSISIPDNVSNIGSEAFYNCSGITSLSIPVSVSKIGSKAFGGCYNLTTITCLAQYPPAIYYDTFSNYYADLYVPAGCKTSYQSANYWSNFNIIEIETKFNIDGLNYITTNVMTEVSVINLDNGNKYSGDIVIPETVNFRGVNYKVTSIRESAFSDCSSLTSITISNNITSIGDWAFYGCNSLTSVKIPNGVISIGSGVFSMCSGMTSVTIGNSVTEIGDWAFNKCSLISITVPNSVTSIGKNAFASCDRLTSIIVEGGNTKYDSRNNCNAIIETKTNTLIAGCSSTIIPDNVTKIGDYAFYNCSGLTSIIIPNSVRSIGVYVFNNCDKLKDITCYATNPPKISEDTFFDYSATLYVPFECVSAYKSTDYWKNFNIIQLPHIPKLEVASVAPTNESEVESLSTVILTFTEPVTINAEAGELSIINIADPNNDFAKNFNVDISEDGLTATITCVPGYPNDDPRWTNNATYKLSIPAGYFISTSDATSETIEYSWKVVTTYPNSFVIDGVTYNVISHYNLAVELTDGKSCTGEIVIPSSITYGGKTYTVTSIGDWAFYGCSSLTSIDIPNSVIRIGDRAFLSCDNLMSVTIPNSVTNIGEYIFAYCSNLISVNIPIDVTNIGNGIFSNCRSLTSVVLPINITSIPESMFNGCSSLISIDIPDGVTSIGESAFNGCSSLTSVELPINITKISESMFNGCRSLTSINIPNSVTSIEEYAFNYCSNLISVNIPNTVTNIENGTFKGCSSLTSIDIPNCVSSIGDWAFSNCSSLTSIDIPDSVTSIGKFAFEYTGLTSIDIPDSVKSIGLWAFIKCSSLIWVKIGNGVTSIEDATFSGCSGLTSVVLGNGVTRIGEDAFVACSSLTSIDIPDGVISIGKKAFWGCSSLSSLVIGSSVTCIENEAFIYCSLLKEIICYAINPPTIYENTFYNKSATLYVPNGCETAYRNADYWNKFIIKAISQLEVPTVSPANGAEVESLNTITLTFAEAVTVNAEAGELTMVNTSDAAYDYAKNFNVTISEDGLTATITCVPGYPYDNPRWTNNATYKLNVPTGYFVATSGATSDALEYSWKIAAAKFTYVDVTPAQGEVTELSEILIGFANRAYGNSSLPTLNLVDADGNVVTTASTARAQNANGDWYAIKATLKDKVTAPGTYTLVVPADVFKDTDFGEGVTNAAFDLTWTIKEVEVDPNTYNFAWNVNPAEGRVSELKTIVFTAATAGQMLMPTDEAQVANWVKVTDQDGNIYNTTAEAGTGYDVTIEGATAPGTYTVVVPKGSFYDLMASITNPNSKNFNDEIVLTYTIKAANPNTYTLAINANPASGSTLTALDNISFSAATAGVIAMPTTEAQSAGWFSITDANGNSYNYTAKIGVGLDLTIEGATVPGIYTVVVPAKSFVDAMTMNAESKNYNAEMVLTYIVEGETVEDFTPVISPAAGDITVDQMNVTVISVDSPIVSFDDSYVRYIKAIGGNVWFVGSYKISDDKLTLTLNWDLVKGNYPPGTSYTLELPAGCIVLENGAKNLLTQVAYTVVAGPKDLAEFVVPAGINGYINYDETDVNAWAPEFPFTVSTTAYNTVAFAAELPSLPAQLTAIEVIDSNDQAIALLDYAHDGAIYYVKGETTKEYVDGAELKFRFRFTHLGVSETIQFSYKVAGGNITSIADVELNGNVIVRGNDIIVPEGAAVFSASGIRVAAKGLAPGVYVVVLGNQAVKVIVK